MALRSVRTTALLWTAALVLPTASGLAAEEPAKPNILFIAIDDLNDWVNQPSRATRKCKPRIWTGWPPAAPFSPTPTVRRRFAIHREPA